MCAAESLLRLSQPGQYTGHLQCERIHFKRPPPAANIYTGNIEFKIMTNSVCHIHTHWVPLWPHENERPSSILRHSVETFRGKLRWLRLLLRVMLLYHNNVIDVCAIASTSWHIMAATFVSKYFTVMEIFQ